MMQSHENIQKNLNIFELKLKATDANINDEMKNLSKEKDDLEKLQKQYDEINKEK